MEITLRINDFLGQDKDGRYNLQCDSEGLADLVRKHPQWAADVLFAPDFLRKNPKIIERMLNCSELRNLIYTKEANRRAAAETLKQANKMKAEAQLTINGTYHITDEELARIDAL